MRGVHPLPDEHPVLTEMREVFYSHMLAQPYHPQESWRVRPHSTILCSHDGSHVFFGELIIEREGNIVWRFCSRGWCKNDMAEHCIRSAREHSYRLREFNGACGPEHYEFLDYRYTNKSGYPSYGGMAVFNVVKGREEVTDLKGEVAAWCVYDAMLLRDDFTKSM